MDYLSENLEIARYTTWWHDVYDACPSQTGISDLPGIQYFEKDPQYVLRTFAFSDELPKCLER